MNPDTQGTINKKKLKKILIYIPPTIQIIYHIKN